MDAELFRQKLIEAIEAIPSRPNGMTDFGWKKVKSNPAAYVDRCISGDARLDITNRLQTLRYDKASKSWVIYKGSGQS